MHLRFVIVLSLIYLCLVLMLYQFLWKSHKLDSGLNLLDFTSLPHERDTFDFSNDTVEFNFKRRNGFLQDTNGSINSLLNTSESTNSSFFPQNSSYDVINMKKPLFDVTEMPLPSYCIHAFYYMWYGNPQHNEGRYFHWNHKYLPHWQEDITKRYPTGRHVPPDDIGASFYPKLGCYSSSDPKIMEEHMYQLRQARVGVISVSWYPKGLGDDEGFPPDPLIPDLLDIAEMYSIKVTIHIEPYKGRSPLSVRTDLKYITEKYSVHPAFYKHNSRKGSKFVPLVYIYDSYLNAAHEWAEILKPGKVHSIRGTDFDCAVIGLMVDAPHKRAILDGGFDGFYTYFASRDFSYGSTVRNWDKLYDFARRNNLIFIPSFGPGYDDVRVRPWNAMNMKPRRNGQYYKEMFREAIRTCVNSKEQNTGIVSLTSFNEWHEGTQIESAIPKISNGFTYIDYTPHQPDFFLQLTKELSTHMQCNL